MTNIGERINKLRKSKKMTLEQLGEKVGVGKSTVRKWENGIISNMRQDKITKLADALDVTPSYLMGWENENKIGNKLKTLREEKNISLMELADELHIDTTLLKEYEDGIKKIPHELLEKFASYFNTTVDNLMGIELEAERKHVVITSSETLMERYKKWQEQVGYNKYTDKEIDQLIEVAKLMQQMNDDEINKFIEYGEFLISRK